MAATSTIELTDLTLACDIGAYGPGDVVPKAHLLDLTLGIDAALVLIDHDGMEHVFDYDPLIAEIDRLARDGPYATQERLITRVLTACAAEPCVTAADIHLRKTPVLGETGALGVRVSVDAEGLAALRDKR